MYSCFLIWMESRPKKYAIQNLNDITPKSALGVGLFQALALIPGTSRSGATILGGTLLGFDRPTIVEFTFYLAIPTMLGASIVKIIKFIVKGAVMNVTGFFTLIVGMAISFLVSVVAIRYVMAYIRKHDFRIFGIYRILLGIIVLIFTLFKVIA
jgi:undecaprenyl-diphosphatase